MRWSRAFFQLEGSVHGVEDVLQREVDLGFCRIEIQ